MNDWTNIHKDFNKESIGNKTYQQYWEEVGISYQEAKEWKKFLGWKFKLKDFAFYIWLKNEKNLIAQNIEKKSNVISLKEEYKKIWTNAHNDFAKRPNWSSETFQWYWEEKGLTCQDAQIWIPLGFMPWNYDGVLLLTKQWKFYQFSPQETRVWIGAGLEKLNKKSAEFANYLRKRNYQPTDSNIREIIFKENWRDIHKDLNYSLRKGWESENFNKEQTKEWIDAEAKVNDYKFVRWLIDTKNLESGWIANYKDDYQLLSDRFKKYGLCSECNHPNTGGKWCQPCNAFRLKQDFANWTSHNLKVNEFIQKYQLQATDADKFIEWITYEQFTNIKYLDKGGFGEVYKAQWTAGNVHHWDKENKQWNREKDYYYEDKDKSELDFEQNKDKYKKYKDYREVVLKILTNSQDNTDFLQETEKYKIIDDWFNNIVSCYGISRDPQGNYLMVMQYMPEGNLRQYLSKNNKELNLKDKFGHLVKIVQGLKDIHQKNLVHHDFHLGNILKGIEKTECLITDLGLCKPVDEISQEKKIFGVLPYVAPEVLQSQPYTQASDIYSFGIVAYEALSGLPPYYDQVHDFNLGAAICQGLRPTFQIKIPPLLEDLINRCWDKDLAKRPTTQELEKSLRDWEQGNAEFKKQLREAEEYNKNLPGHIKFPNYKIHHGAVYTSRLLPTKEIAHLLQKSDQQQALELEIKKLEKEINRRFTDEQKELVKEFIKASQKAIKNKEDEVAKNKVDKLEDELKKKLKESNFYKEEIKKIIRHCEKLVELAKQLKSMGLQTQVEVPANK